MVAREKGLDPLADLILAQSPAGPPEKIAEKFVNDQVPTAAEALQGARDIVAERISDNANVRARLREKALKFSKVRVEKIKDAVDEKAVYQSYYDFEYRVDRLQPHQVLAFTRGEKEGVLRVHVDVADRDWLDAIQAEYEQDILSPFADQLALAIQDPPNGFCCLPSSGMSVGKKGNGPTIMPSRCLPATCGHCSASHPWPGRSSWGSTLAFAPAASLPL